MIHIYELKVNDKNKLNLTYINQFENYDDYKNNVYNKYDLGKEIDIACVFTEESLINFIDMVNKVVKPNNNSNEIEYYAFSNEHKEIEEFGKFDSEKDFLEYYYDDSDDVYAFDDSLASDYDFYFTYDSIQEAIIHFQKIMNTKNTNDLTLRIVS